MDLTLKRLAYRPDGIFSELFDESGIHVCFCLEHAYAFNGSGFLPKLPSGSYICQRGQHQLYGMPKAFETFEITGVPGHTDILFHVGNFNNDSEGCVLVGENILIGPANGIQTLSHSMTTFAKLMELQLGINEFMLEVIGQSY